MSTASDAAAAAERAKADAARAAENERQIERARKAIEDAARRKGK